MMGISISALLVAFSHKGVPASVIKMRLNRVYRAYDEVRAGFKWEYLYVCTIIQRYDVSKACQEE
jgi:hypothetical protein